MPNRSTSLFTVAALLALPLAACEQSPTVSSSPGQVTGTASVQLTGSSAGAAASPALVRLSAQAQGNGGNVSLDVVSSIDVTLASLEVLRLEDEDGRWVALDVENAEIDLLDLPADGLEVARGELEAGDYCNLRLFVDDPTITFSEDVTHGGGPAATTFAAGEPHPLFIPSEDETGIKVPALDFTVDEEQETVTLAFDAGQSVQTVNLTGRGVLMTPVLTPDDESGEEIAGCDAVEDDEEDEDNGGESGEENGEENGGNGDEGSSGDGGSNGGS